MDARGGLFYSFKTAPTAVTERPPGPPLGDTSTKASSAALMPQTASLPLTQKSVHRDRTPQAILIELQDATTNETLCGASIGP